MARPFELVVLDPDSCLDNHIIFWIFEPEDQAINALRAEIKNIAEKIKLESLNVLQDGNANTATMAASATIKKDERDLK